MKKLLLLIAIVILSSCSKSNLERDKENCISTLKANLNDANSFELVDFQPYETFWRIDSANGNWSENKEGKGNEYRNDYHMRCRAKNGFGALVISDYEFFVNHKTGEIWNYGLIKN